MSARPRQVRVGPLTYRIVVDPASIKAASDAAGISPGSSWTAFSDHDALIIGINPANPEDVQKRDVVHELLHCVLRFSGVWPVQYAETVEKAGADGGYTVEEFIVAAQSAPLLMVLRDNPSLLRWLLA